MAAKVTIIDSAPIDETGLIKIHGIDDTRAIARQAAELAHSIRHRIEPVEVEVESYSGVMFVIDPGREPYHMTRTNALAILEDTQCEIPGPETADDTLFGMAAFEMVSLMEAEMTCADEYDLDDINAALRSDLAKAYCKAAHHHFVERNWHDVVWNCNEAIRIINGN